MLNFETLLGTHPGQESLKRAQLLCVIHLFTPIIIKISHSLTHNQCILYSYSVETGLLYNNDISKAGFARKPELLPSDGNKQL